MEEHIYFCIDLKSFFASVECVTRNLDSLTTKLAVVDPSRGKGAICLAISPALRALGIKNRCRLFEIPENIDYLVAIPRMKYYIDYAADIYAIYLKYVSKEDIHVYSIDECFLDVTSYLNMYNMSPYQLAKTIVDDVYKSTGILASAGIGTNMFLAKVALDILAKKSSENISYLDIELFKKTLWHHQPLTDIWNIGPGIAKRLLKYNIHNLYGITIIDEKILYKEFGVNAEFLIDHAHGVEPCTIKDIHEYKSQTNSFSNGQILYEDYSIEDAFLVFKEMVETNVLELVSKNLITNSIFINIGYSKNTIKSTGGQIKIDEYTNSYNILKKYFYDLFKKTTNPNYLIRKITIGFSNLIDETYRTINLFTDEVAETKEKSLQKTILSIKKKYGKNSILKAMDLQEKATTKKRNKLIGGHNSE